MGKMNSLIKSLVFYFIGTGLVIDLVSLTALLTGLLMPKTFVIVGLLMIYPKRRSTIAVSYIILLTISKCIRTPSWFCTLIILFMSLHHNSWNPRLNSRDRRRKNLDNEFSALPETNLTFGNSQLVNSSQWIPENYWNKIRILRLQWKRVLWNPGPMTWSLDQ